MLPLIIIIVLRRAELLLPVGMPRVVVPWAVALAQVEPLSFVHAFFYI